MNDSKSHLTRLGWSAFFQQQLDDTGEEPEPARVVGVRKNLFLVRRDQAEFLATIAGRLLHGPDTLQPAVGDWVLLRQSVITSVLERRNALSRKAPAGRGSKGTAAASEVQVMAANLDTVLIVCGLDRDFNPRRIERYLTLVYTCGVSPAIILTKADLHPNPQECVALVEGIAIGVPTLPVSTADSETIAHVAALLPCGSTACLVGSSGAGKSTLINRLAGEEIRTTSSLGTRVGKGRHTTTTRDMIILPWGGMVIDNPGIREIALSLDEGAAGSAFGDIETLAVSCRFADCSHSHEPGCRVLAAVSAGEIEEKRLANYRKIQNELSYQRLRQNASPSRVEKTRWKNVSQKIKTLKKNRLR